MGLWQFRVSARPGQGDPIGRQTLRTFADFGISTVQEVRTARLYTIELADSDLPEREAVERIASELLADPVCEDCTVMRQGAPLPEPQGSVVFEVHLKPGVMDRVAESTMLALRDMGVEAASVRTARRYEIRPKPSQEESRQIPRLLGNDCIEDVVIGAKPIEPPPRPPIYEFKLRYVLLRDLDEAGLTQLSRQSHLFLSVEEMRAMQSHYRDLGRDPTDLELETLAQTWSEHCVHKTLRSTIEYRGAPFPDGDQSGATQPIVRRYDNLLKDTIVRATEELVRAGRGPQCLSVFRDNAGIIAFDDQYAIAFKVETHNHPSAIEPYGGAATGVGGVIRDILGCGLGAKPIANTDVFCVAPPDWPVDAVPQGVIHPLSVLIGVVAGVRDYGNRMGIPTVNGAIHFDARYLGNPLVYCGCVGLIRRDRIDKAARTGDAIVLIGGRTGRDGIHGATFSSAELTDTHEDEFAHAVQIGNPIEEKKVLDVILQARDVWHRLTAGGPVWHRPIAGGFSACLYSAITDCGAGGLSSAVGEMAAEIGAVVNLEKVPLKYAGLRYDEIWISEAQERMVLAVPPEHLEALLALAASEDVEATVIGQFTNIRRLVVRYEGAVVGDLDMDFLHHGLPRATRAAEWHPLPGSAVRTAQITDLQQGVHYAVKLKALLSHPSTASKHWVIRQYDHEVQAGSVVKPLIGKHDGPSDAAVIRPRLDSDRGVAIACGLAPQLSDIDPYWMAVAAIDEALRNVICVGGDPANTAILDNFCWPRADDARNLGALVRACQACCDAAIAYGLPFISGKDSLNNEFALNDADAAMIRDVLAARYPEAGAAQAALADTKRLAIPYTLLTSAISVIDDVNRCITAAPRLTNDAVTLFYIGFATDDWTAARLDALAQLHAIVAALIRSGDIVSAHDCSDGGIAAAVAEMAFASDFAVDYFVAPDGFLADPFATPISAYIVQAADRAALKPAVEVPGVLVAAVARLSRPVGKPVFRFVLQQRPDERPAASPLCLSMAPLADLRTAWLATLDW